MSTPESSSRRPFTITCVRRDPDAGYWTARLTVDGRRTLQLDRRFGSWRISPRRGESSWRELVPFYAAAVQVKVRRLERAERRAGSAVDAVAA